MHKVPGCQHRRAMTRYHLLPVTMVLSMSGFASIETTKFSIGLSSSRLFLASLATTIQITGRDSRLVESQWKALLQTSLPDSYGKTIMAMRSWLPNALVGEIVNTSRLTYHSTSCTMNICWAIFLSVSKPSGELQNWSGGLDVKEERESHRNRNLFLKDSCGL